jgi:hypothetical protein
MTMLHRSNRERLLEIILTVIECREKIKLLEEEMQMYKDSFIIKVKHMFIDNLDTLDDFLSPMTLNKRERQLMNSIIFLHNSIED